MASYVGVLRTPEYGKSNKKDLSRSRKCYLTRGVDEADCRKHAPQRQGNEVGSLFIARGVVHSRTGQLLSPLRTMTHGRDRLAVRKQAGKLDG